MQRSRVLLAAAAMSVIGAGPLAAQPPDRGDTPGLGWGAGGSQGAPGPVAGAGLSFLLVAGAVGAYRRLRQRRAEQVRAHKATTQGGTGA